MPETESLPTFPKKKPFGRIVHIYLDITNTYVTQLNTGIQRVSKELIRRLYDYNLVQTEMEFIPVCFDQAISRWKTIRRGDFEQLYRGKQRSGPHRALRKMGDFLRMSCLKDFSTNAVFVDMDSTWHSPLKRRDLFKNLKDQGIRIASMHYDLTPILFPEFCHPNTVSVFSDHMLAAVTYSDLFICISKESEKRLLVFGEKHIRHPSFKTTVLKLGADFFVPDKKIAQTNRPGRKGRIFDPRNTKGTFLLCVGTLEPRKNHTFLLDVFEKVQARFPDLQMVIVGKKGWNVEDLILRITGHKLYNRSLFWLDNVLDEELADLYKQALLCIVPSHFEGYGLPVVEALRHGKITLCSNNASLMETGGKYADYFELSEPGQLERLISDYYGSANMRIEREKVIENFKPCSWDESAKAFARIMKKFVLDCYKEA